ncbi:MAG: entericidin A/B family lipoprotein [Burkholderiaceae bacterium]|nr:entericidin A/B family lipoprotein [Burkholderiaceae bacterium]
MSKPILLALIAALVGAAISGCNTIEGVGKDLKRAGDKVQDAARK